MKNLFRRSHRCFFLWKNDDTKKEHRGRNSFADRQIRPRARAVEWRIKQSRYMQIWTISETTIDLSSPVPCRDGQEADRYTRREKEGYRRDSIRLGGVFPAASSRGTRRSVFTSPIAFTRWWKASLTQRAIVMNLGTAGLTIDCTRCLDVTTRLTTGTLSTREIDSVPFCLAPVNLPLSAFLLPCSPLSLSLSLSPSLVLFSILNLLCSFESFAFISRITRFAFTVALWL